MSILSIVYGSFAFNPRAFGASPGQTSKVPFLQFELLVYTVSILHWLRVP